MGLGLRVALTPPFPGEDRETWLKAPKNLLSGPTHCWFWSFHVIC